MKDTLLVSCTPPLRVQDEKASLQGPNHSAAQLAFFSNQDSSHRRQHGMKEPCASPSLKGSKITSSELLMDKFSQATENARCASTAAAPRPSR